MSFNRPGMSWSALEGVLSGREKSVRREKTPQNLPPPTPATPPSAEEEVVPYAELHVHSHFSFLDGVSSPESLLTEATRLGLSAVGLTDHDGMYGVVRFSEAAREGGIHTVFGAELNLGLTTSRQGTPDPDGTHLLALARGPEGYGRLCRVISSAQLRGEEKNLPVYDMDEIISELREHCIILTGCRKGAVRQALAEHGPAAAAKQLQILIDHFGLEHVVVELIDHGQPADSTTNDVLFSLANELGVLTLASNNVHYARPQDAHLANAIAAIRARRSAEDIAGWLPPPTAYLRSGAEMATLFRRYPGVVANAAFVGAECAFDLQVLAPNLPLFDVPPGHTEKSYLRELTWAGATDRYGSRAANPKAYRQIDHELAIIEKLEFPGYFLIVWNIVEFCKRHNILCQGRGSAANSAVCFALGITNADPVKWGLLFERFLAPERDGPPDIDVDIESDRREEVIQYVYQTYGRQHAAQVANVITYRTKSALRDVARAFGYAPGQQDAWAKAVERWDPIATIDSSHNIPMEVVTMTNQLLGAPRHLGIHSGGMVICDRPVSEVVPVEWARMAGRSVIQWDKEDCAAVGIVKFDLLGLGMLSAVHYAQDLISEHHSVAVDIAKLDLADPKVYDMLCAADAIGVFQVESRAQLSTLPRLKPRKFYDLVVEVALIRPGPIQGGSVHPYIRRRNEEEEWEHPHPLLANALDRTLGVPLFQEQVMQMAVDVAGFTPAEADQLRQAMGSKRSTAKMERLRQRFFVGAEKNGITGELAERIFDQVYAFSGYGFPEAHSMSFALLVYTSAYLKKYYPAAFTAALLRAQPMGFYSAQSLVADARRHGIVVRQPDIHASLEHPTLEDDPASAGGKAIRLGLARIRGLSGDTAERIVAERTVAGPYRDIHDLSRRVALSQSHLEALATSGAFASFTTERRQALWVAGAAARDRPEFLPGTSGTSYAPALPGMSTMELAAADVWATGISPNNHPIEFLRKHLTEQGALAVSTLSTVEDGTRIWVGGAITHRQRPATAGGVTFLGLEDETGILNVVCSPGLWKRHAVLARTSPGLLIRGILHHHHTVLSLEADKLEPLTLPIKHKSRDFQ